MFLKLLINNLDKTLTDKLSKSKIKEINKILTKKVITIQDINNICGFKIDINDISFNNKNINELVYLYLIRTKDKNNIKIVMEKMNYKYNIEEIILLDKYIKYRKYKNNKLILEIINKISNELDKEEDTEFKQQIKKMYEFKKIFDDNTFPYELITNFIKVDRCSNLYIQLKEIEKAMSSNNDLEFKKKMILIYYTYNFKIDDKVINSLFNIKLDKNDIINFISELEEKEISINNNQLKNMLGNFRKQYLEQNNILDKYNYLCDKVVKEYVKYYSKNFYFKEKDFIKYYNDLFNDDFSCFIFKKDKILLNEEILGSIFNKYSLLGDYFLFRSDINPHNIFKETEKNACKYLINQEKIFKERKKFYKKYKSKINKYINESDNMCLKYFIFKYIDKEDKMYFYELFKTIYKDNYKLLENKKGSLVNSANLLKKDFVNEVLTNSFNKRYKIKQKYIDVSNEIGCSCYIKDNYYDIVLEELERKYKILLGKEIIYRLKNSKDKKAIYNKLTIYIEKELGITNIDELFNSLSKKHSDMKVEYFIIKNDIKCKVKKKRCK